MYREVIKIRKKEKNVTNQWIAEQTGIMERTVSRMLSAEESAEALFSNVCKVAEVLDLSVGDLSSRAREEFGGKRVKEILSEYEKLLEECAELREDLNRLLTENEALKREAAEANSKAAALEIENDRLHLTLAHKEDVIAHKEEIVSLQKKLLDVYRSSANDKYNGGL